MSVNSTFRGGEPDWANACVGQNGMPDYFDYAQGYSSAANLLIKSVLEDEGFEYSVDKFVYPICFNMRHSIELRLKGVVGYLEKISAFRVPLGAFDLKSSHDLGRIWCYIKRESQKLDKRFSLFIAILDDRILDVANIDSTGQTFRYPVDNDQSKHLVDVSSINIKILSDRFVSLECMLDNFEAFCDELVREYKVGTHTKELSRADLLSIGEKVPARSNWVLQEFKDFKQSIVEKYKLSNRGFAGAINIIEARYGIAPKLMSPPLKYVDIEVLKLFLGAWCEKNDVVNSRLNRRLVIESWGGGNADELLDSIRHHTKMERLIWPRLEGCISVDALIGLKSLCDSHGVNYSEEYISHVEYNERDLRQGLQEGSIEHQRAVMKLIGRPMAGDYILKSIFLLGHVEIAENLIKCLGLEGSLVWLPKARTRELFVEPYVGIYKKMLESCCLP